MKKRLTLANYRCHALFLLVLALILNSVMLTGCNMTGSKETTGTRENATDAYTPPITPGSSAESSNDQPLIKNNVAAEKFLLSMAEEGTEYSAETLIKNTANMFAGDSITISEYSGYIKAFRAKYGKYKLDTGTITLNHSFNVSINDLKKRSELSEEQIEALELIKSFNEFYVLAHHSSEVNPAIVISYRDTVYFMPTMKREVIAIYSFKVNL